MKKTSSFILCSLILVTPAVAFVNGHQGHQHRKTDHGQPGMILKKQKGWSKGGSL